MKSTHTNVKLAPILLIAAGIIIVAIVLIWQGQKRSDTAATSATASAEIIPFPDIVRVTPADAKKAYDAYTALFVDTRDAGSYATSHITNSLNIPLAELEQRYKELDSNTWIITYCT